MENNSLNEDNNIKQFVTQKYFLGLITRCKDEFFIKEFCDYYISQGVDKIFVIDDDSNDKSIYNNINDHRVEIIYKKNIIKTNYANDLYKQVKSNFTWMIYCDVDEFITTRRRIKNTIRDELETTFKDVHFIKIPWVMMSCNSREKNPNSILLENTYRWNHNKRHPHDKEKFRCRYDIIETKCIFKTNKFNGFSRFHDHHPINRVGRITSVESINKHKRKCLSTYGNLREANIEKGILVCYHYRIISKENSINKLKTNFWYINNGYTIDDLMSSDHAEIIDETLKYKVIDEKLKLVHITKTSGSYLEEIARQKNLNWGKYDKYLKKAKLPNESNPSFWHLPLQFFDKYPYESNTKLFTIVRNPYDRIISECLCRWGGKFAKKMETKEDLNNYINIMVKNASNLNFHHFMPQHLYTHNKNGVTVIDYIIKYEEMHKFNELMKDYSIDINYTENKKDNKKFSVKDISIANIKLINEIYHLDFIYFNYEKIIN